MKFLLYLSVFISVIVTVCAVTANCRTYVPGDPARANLLLANYPFWVSSLTSVKSNNMKSDNRAQVRSKVFFKKNAEMSLEERAIIYLYTLNNGEKYYANLNCWLTNSATHPNPPPYIRRGVELLGTGLPKLVPTSQARVFRGTGMWQEAQVGDIVRNKGFLSTSLNPDVSMKFTECAPNCWRLQFEAGHPAVPLAGLTAIAGENEALMPSGNCFQVIARDMPTDVSWPKITFAEGEDLPAKRAAHVKFAERWPDFFPKLETVRGGKGILTLGEGTKGFLNLRWVPCVNTAKDILEVDGENIVDLGEETVSLANELNELDVKIDEMEEL